MNRPPGCTQTTDDCAQPCGGHRLSLLPSRLRPGGEQPPCEDSPFWPPWPLFDGGVLVTAAGLFRALSTSPPILVYKMAWTVPPHPHAEAVGELPFSPSPARELRLGKSPVQGTWPGAAEPRGPNPSNSPHLSRFQVSLHQVNHYAAPDTSQSPQNLTSQAYLTVYRPEN